MDATVLVYQMPVLIKRVFIYNKDLIRSGVNQALKEAEEVLVGYKGVTYLCKDQRKLRIKKHPLSRFLP